MNKKIPVSVVISAFNEEKKIADCLDSVSFADEVIVIDNTSTDNTAVIAKKHGAKVYTRENNLMLNVNKNFGFTKATHDWILNIDADERITPELAEEITQVIENKENNVVGYWIPRKNIIFGKWIEHTGWSPDHVLRLFKKQKGKFEEKHVHEMITVDGDTAYLKQPLVHLNYETISQFLHKTSVIYAPNEAKMLLQNGYEFNVLDALRFPFREFLSRFFAREGYKDGLHGLMLSLLMAFYHLIVFANLWEMKKFTQVNENILDTFNSEMKKENKEILYWIYTEKMKHATSSLEKAKYTLKKKFSQL